MTYSLRFLPEIEEDVIAGYVWYEEKSKGLGEDFLRMFYACTTEIARNPLIFPKVHEEFRRRLLRRFPYAVYFMKENDEIIVFGLFHCARDPRTIRTELENRDETD
jgi:plasmid stabilization system protein ParE